MAKKRDTQGVRDFILEWVSDCSPDMTKAVMGKFGISRQAVAKNIRALIADGLIVAKGSTRNKSYSLKPLFEHKFSISITEGVEENQIWMDHLSPHLTNIKDNVREICQHGFTEMMNNVIDHSQSEKADIRLWKDAVLVGFTIRDHGIGIWKKLRDRFQLSDSRHAILELAKGKLTTDPSNHTGEGIFFTSRMSDFFSIQSEDLAYCCLQADSGWLFNVKEEKAIQGTRVNMEIRLNSEKTSRQVFDEFTSEYDAFGFSKTQLSIQLAKYEGDHLVSRSQAKRILVHLQKFKEVWLDFRGITYIGQAFADEIFRVFRNAHPEVHLKWNHASPDVESMILRATSSTIAEEQQQPELPLI